MNDEFLTSKEAQDFLKVSNVTLWRMAKEGKIQVYKVNNRNRYRRGDLENFMEENRVTPVMMVESPGNPLEKTG